MSTAVRSAASVHGAADGLLLDGAGLAVDDGEAGLAGVVAVDDCGRADADGGFDGLMGADEAAGRTDADEPGVPPPAGSPSSPHPDAHSTSPAAITPLSRITAEG